MSVMTSTTATTRSLQQINYYGGKVGVRYDVNNRHDTVPATDQLLWWHSRCQLWRQQLPRHGTCNRSITMVAQVSVMTSTTATTRSLQQINYYGGTVGVSYDVNNCHDTVPAADQLLWWHSRCQLWRQQPPRHGPCNRSITIVAQ